jgi:hypothetical protein
VFLASSRTLVGKVIIVNITCLGSNQRFSVSIGVDNSNRRYALIANTSDLENVSIQVEFAFKILYVIFPI